MARRRPTADTQEPLIIIHSHGLLARILHDDLIRPRHVPEISRLIKEGSLVSLIAACARQPFVRDVAVEGCVAFGSGAGVAAVGCVVPSVIVLAAVADWKTPFAWKLVEGKYLARWFLHDLLTWPIKLWVLPRLSAIIELIASVKANSSV